MRVGLERGKCVGHAQCSAVSPDLFPLDDYGYSTLEDHDVVPGDEAAIREGVDACPERALFIIDEPH
ncbi:ferredoxin [Mycobacterium sp. SMC-8]|uniref:ferredoxin n=1 Tax=Mycobacterium sp. SMC-8 TaxID=2857060 RepID=UPI0021B2A86E|nr:ferredoxin [Mycobacterium sp. SMC-8]UXA11559.1 ferredoxin [Mycobacterium sp. SMC-8]